MHNIQYDHFRLVWPFDELSLLPVWYFLTLPGSLNCSTEPPRLQNNVWNAPINNSSYNKNFYLSSDLITYFNFNYCPFKVSGGFVPRKGPYQMLILRILRIKKVKLWRKNRNPASVQTKLLSIKSLQVILYACKNTLWIKLLLRLKRDLSKGS